LQPYIPQLKYRTKTKLMEALDIQKQVQESINPYNLSNDRDYDAVTSVIAHRKGIIIKKYLN
jgi:hypothetical protein